jgi:hypothetical protein
MEFLLTMLLLSLPSLLLLKHKIDIKHGRISRYIFIGNYESLKFL